MSDKYDEETRILLRFPPNYSGGTICDDVAARLRADGDRIAKLEAVSMAAKGLINGMNHDDWRWLTADHRQTLTQLDEALRDLEGK
jgi:hypothetical protein